MSSGTLGATDGLVGLTSADARTRHLEGANELPRPSRPSLARRILRHAREPLSLVLLVVAAASGVVLGHLAEALTITAIVSLNVLIGVLQEQRADDAVAALEDLTAPTARVRRDGTTVVVPAREVVAGDVVELAAGDRVPADLRLELAAAFAVDESILTGESLPVPRGVGDDALAGTMAVRGTAVGTVVQIGPASRLGQIASAIGSRSTPPLVHELRRVAARLSIAAVALGALLIPLAIARDEGHAVGEAVLAGVALAIAAIPEGLPAVVTASLALGSRRMAAHGAIVRELHAIETLGAATVLCSDKTGTLTTGRVAVVDAIPVGDDDAALWRAALRCIDGVDEHGDPIDIAIAEAAVRAGCAPGPERRIAVAPFDAGNRSMTTVTATDSGSVVTVKGAPEVVLARCARTPATTALEARIPDLTARGLRVLAVAEGSGDDLDQTGLLPLGLLAFADPLRASAPGAVAACARAGVRIVMVTGDHAATARSIASAAGLPDEPTVSGDDLADLDERSRADALRAAAVVARVDPGTKVDLVHAHRDAGEVVAMTGDGVNDAPALRAAHVGVAVAGAGGTDVARQAADVVVTSGDLGTIVTAIGMGRRVHASVATVVAYLVTGNLSEILTVAGALVLLPEIAVPLLPVQLLWLNLVTDGMPAVALGVDEGVADPLHQRPRRLAEPLLSGRRLGVLGLRSTAVAGAALGCAVLARRWGWSEDAVRSQLLLALLSGHLLLAYTTRASLATFERGWSRSRPVRVGVVASFLLQAPVFGTAVGREIFSLDALPAVAWALALGGALLAALVIDLGRCATRWRTAHRPLSARAPRGSARGAAPAG